MNIFTHLRFVLFIWIYHQKLVICQPTFMIPFQTRIKYTTTMSPSVDEWIEFTNKINPAKEFTACHWIRTKYFNYDIAFQLWSYCPLAREGDLMECLQIGLYSSGPSASRDVEITAWIPHQKTYIKAPHLVKDFLHLTWVHFCWVASTIDGKNRFYYNGRLIGSDEKIPKNNQEIIKNSTGIYDSALIFGQEPDNIRGGFESFQAFIGDLAEFNIWNHTLSDEKIMDIAKCQYWGKGNIVAWRKAGIKVHGVAMKDIKDANSLCYMTQNIVIFPRKVIYPEAVKICAAYGGKLVLPETKEENNVLLNIVKKHKNNCIAQNDSVDRNAVWIGAKVVNETWYQINSVASLGKKLSYSNFPRSNATNYGKECAYMLATGMWQGGGTNTCSGLGITLCTVCSINNTPVFTLKGVCYESDIDWNFYMVFDNNNQLAYFDGYKDTKIIPINENPGWKIFFKKERGPSFKAEIIPKSFSTTIPVGRFKWHIKDDRCKYDQRELEIALSQCKFGTQFTCDSGHCVNLNQRCNGVVDCDDESDEEKCDLINFTPSYRKDNPPNTMKYGKPSSLHTSIEVINIDFINTIDMTVGITAGIRIKWLDGRLDYFNLLADTTNVVPMDKLQEIWLPTRQLTIENAILGEIEYDDNRQVTLHPNVSQNIKVELPRENRVCSGSNSFLEVFQRVKVKFNCIFDVYKFPFDEQSCDLVFKLEHSKTNKVTFVMDQFVAYHGSSNVDQFKIGSMSTNVNNTQGNTKFILTVPFHRVSTIQLLKTFLPTLLLCFLGYSTMMIDIDSSSDRFMGSVTMMLVLMTWIGVINGDLPKTSYVKMIDCWFIWHVVITFLINIYHISLDKLGKTSLRTNVIDVGERDERISRNTNTMKKEKSLQKDVNKIVLTIFFVLNCTFGAVYCMLSLY